jgi:hypothetical protein
LLAGAGREQEFRDFLTCGILAHGFARLRCTECALERLVPFSCKGRGVCPSCGGRRMTEGAARLVDGVLHTLLLDGVFFEGPEGALAFLPLPPPTDEEVGGVLVRIAARV